MWWGCGQERDEIAADKRWRQKVLSSLQVPFLYPEQGLESSCWPAREAGERRDCSGQPLKVEGPE